jgi:siderophore synthetase component
VSTQDLRIAGPTEAAASRTAEALAGIAPDLLDDFRSCLPAAMDVVNRRLVDAAYRERLCCDPDDVVWAGGNAFIPLTDGGVLVTAARLHGFDRLRVDEALLADPALLLERFAGSDDAARAVGEELTDSCVNLALACARRRRFPAEATADRLATFTDGTDPDVWCQGMDRLATEGHNLHPCGRTRLGWSVGDLLAHDLESPVTEVGFVGIRRDLHIGDELTPGLLPDASTPDSKRYAVTPVHAWQLRLLRDRYAEAVDSRALVPLEATIPAAPTAALRTLLLPAGLSTDDTRYLKLSLDILVTSTRRSISVASTRNGPVLSRLLAELIDDDRVLLFAETAGSAGSLPGGDRDLSAIARSGFGGRLRSREIPVPALALTARSTVPGPDGRERSILAELVDRYRTHRGLTGNAGAAGFLREYARLVLPPLLRLATRHGIGIEAHLQNCLPTFVDGMPHRLGLRDFAGLRLYPARLSAKLQLWPGSVVVTDNVDIMRAKVAYTAVQAHLGEVVGHLADVYGVDEAAAWADVRAVVDEVYDGLCHGTFADRAAADHAFLTARTVPHKALLTMRLADRRGRSGDIHVPVRNPLR